MQRLFSSFPSGAPGIGLLLLRVTVGVALVGQGVQLLGRGAGSVRRRRRERRLVVVGLALLTGSLTPAAAGLGGDARGRARPAGSAPAPARSVLLLVMVAALGLLGPGAYSVDARLFGRREIEVPRASAGADTAEDSRRSARRGIRKASGRVMRATAVHAYLALVPIPRRRRDDAER